VGRVYQGAYELCVLHVDWMLLLRAAPLLLGAWMSGSGVDGPTFIDMAADNLLFISILAAVCCSWLSKEVLFLLARFNNNCPWGFSTLLYSTLNPTDCARRDCLQVRQAAHGRSHIESQRGGCFQGHTSGCRSGAAEAR